MRRWKKRRLRLRTSNQYLATLPSIGWSGEDNNTNTFMSTESKIKEYVKAIHHLVQNDNDGMRILNEQLGLYNLAYQGKFEALQSEVEALQSEILLSKS